VKPIDRQQLIQVVADVLEAQAFMFADEGDGDLPEGAGPCAEIRFDGPTRGHLALALHGGLAVDLAANVLGLEPEACTADIAADALKEVANVACGQILTRIWGEEVVFQLGIPAVRQLDAAGWASLARAPGVAGVRVDGVAVLVQGVTED
jgi:hypothetical protein